MTLLDAKDYHPELDRKKRVRIFTIVIVILALAVVVWWNRFWPEEHVAKKFFSALQQQNYEVAYGVYYHDPDWQQHPQNHSQYPFNEFKQDWGPGGQWGIVRKFRIYGSSNCPGGGTGVVVDSVVNDRAEHAQLYVDKSDKTISTPPCDLEFR
jgi:hypothetical protein